MAKEIAKTDETDGAVAVFDYGENAGVGYEDTTAKDLSIPFLGLLQANSPQVEDQDPPDSRSGMIFNTVTRELIAGDEGIVLLPCHKEGPVWVEWIPRTKGGGFVAVHDPDSDAVKNGTPIINDEGEETRKLRFGENELIETFYVYYLILDKDGLDVNGFAVISYTSTKIKVYRDWVTSTYTLRVPGPDESKVTPPIFANRLKLTTAKQQNRKGQGYHNFRISPFEPTWADGVLSPADEAHRSLMSQAVEFREMVLSGMARAAYETEQSTGDSSGGGTTDSEDPPF